MSRMGKDVRPRAD